jgi:hypothetical protein
MFWCVLTRSSSQRGHLSGCGPLVRRGILENELLPSEIAEEEELGSRALSPQWEAQCVTSSTGQAAQEASERQLRIVLWAVPWNLICWDEASHGQPIQEEGKSWKISFENFLCATWMAFCIVLRLHLDWNWALAAFGHFHNSRYRSAACGPREGARWCR